MTKRGIVFAVAALLALPFVGIVWTSESRCHRDQEAYGAEASQRVGDQESEFALDSGWLPCLAQQITAQRQPRDATEHENRDLIAQETAAGVAFWIAVVAFLQLIATIWGLIYIRGTLRATLEAVEDTSKATTAMERQNEIAEDTARRQLRAYVTVRNFRIENVSPGQIPVVAYEIMNVGQTPAYDAHHVSKSFGGCNVEKISEEKVRLGTPPIMSRTTLGPGVPAPADFEMMERPLSQEEYQQIMRGGIVLGVAGALSYRDIYDRRRITMFKMFAQPGRLKDGAVKLSACTRGNKAN